MSSRIIAKRLCRIPVQLLWDFFIYLSIALPVLYLYLQGLPFENGFLCDDPGLSYPNKPDTISKVVLNVVGLGISVAVVVIVGVLNAIDRRYRRCYSNADNFVFCIKGYGVFLFGFVIQQLIIEIVKNQTGILRPNFFSICRPLFNQSQCPGYISDYICNGSENNMKEIRESRQSFPSGHASCSMYIAFYFCMYIQKHLHVTFSHTLKFVLQTALILQSLICGIGRVRDHKHHPSDVIAGFGLGLVVAVTLFRFVGENVLTDKETYLDKEALNQNKSTSGCCCYCSPMTETETEPQTPTPLLANEYLNSVQNHPIVQTHYNNDRKHMSTPGTLSFNASNM